MEDPRGFVQGEIASLSATKTYALEQMKTVEGPSKVALVSLINWINRQLAEKYRELDTSEEEDDEPVDG